MLSPIFFLKKVGAKHYSNKGPTENPPTNTHNKKPKLGLSIISDLVSLIIARSNSIINNHYSFLDH